MAQQGQFQQADFFDNTGGLNLTDSPFKVSDGQATGGQNYEYALTGGVRKKKGATLINATPDAQLRSLGLGLHITPSNVKTPLRAGGNAFETMNLATGAYTAVSDDTAGAVTSLLSGTQPVCMSQFNNSTANSLWAAGGGLTLPMGFTGTKMTLNGCPTPTGAFSVTGSLTGGSLPNQKYWYAIALKKASTGATSNAALDIQVDVSGASTNVASVTLNLSGLTSLDLTKYSSILIYRSAAGGSTGFTTGDLVATVAASTTSYVDTGAVYGTASLVPRSGNINLDKSVLPAGTYNVSAVFKRRYVTAQGSTLYFSDVNLPESWPAGNSITVPSGGPITGLSVISFTTPTSATINEILVVFKERELWVVTGSSVADWAVLYVDAVGTVAQNLIVQANGYLFWVDYRGVYMWDGSGKPIYCSRPLEILFQAGGEVDKTRLSMGFGVFDRARSLVIWVLSGNIAGEQKYSLKLDLRLTLPNVSSVLGGRILDGAFIQDVLTYPLYCAASFLPTGGTDEIIIAGDASGTVYQLNNANTDAGGAIDFFYETKFLDLGAPGLTKRYMKVVVWTEDSSDSNLTLEYWTGYKSGEADKGSLTQPVSLQVSEPYWDEAYWDSAYFDNLARGFNPLVFNLASSHNSTEGDCIKLRFKQGDSNAPVTIAGFSLIFTILGVRK